MKLRVMHVSHSAALGGAEQALLRLMHAMDRARFESLVVLPADGPLRSALDEIGVRACIRSIRWWIPATHWSAAEFASQFEGLQARWQDLADLAAHEQVNLIHSNTIVTLEGALAAMALGIPHLWHSRGSFGHGFPPAYADDLEFFFSVVDDLADHLACVSNSVLEQTRQYVHNAPCSVIRDGLDFDGLVPSKRADIKKELGLDDESVLIGCIGGIQRRKGQLDLIEAMALAKQEHPQLFLLLCGAVGDAPYGQKLQDRIEELQLHSSVRVLGFRNDIASLINQCRIVVHPSHSEGFPLAVLESMAAGKPVIATRCGGPEDMIEDGVSGVLVNPSAPPELARAICMMLSDNDRAQAIGGAARERARLFSATAYARTAERLFAEIVASTSRSPDPARATAALIKVQSGLDRLLRSGGPLAAVSGRGEAAGPEGFNESMDFLRHEISQRDPIIAEREEAVNGLRSELAAKDRALEFLRNELAAHLRIIAARDEAVSFLKDEVVARDAVISARDEGIAFLRGRAIERERELEALHQALGEFRSKLPWWRKWQIGRSERKYLPRSVGRQSSGEPRN